MLELAGEGKHVDACTAADLQQRPPGPAPQQAADDPQPVGQQLLGVSVGVVVLRGDAIEVLGDIASATDERRAELAPVPVPAYACITASCATKSCGGGPSTSPGASTCTFIIMP